MSLRLRVAKWHRHTGITISVIVAIVSLTGILLNHNADLDLDKHMLKHELIYDMYDMGSNVTVTSYQLDTGILSYLKGALYLKEQRIGEIHEINGAISGPNFIAVSSQDELQLFTQEGELIERLNSASLPHGEIKKLGISQQGLVVLLTSSGLFIEEANMLKWKSIPVRQEHSWASTIEAPLELRTKILNSYRGEGLSIYRVTLDLHSGRIFGKWGTYIFDAAALGLFLLTVSGCYMWYRLARRSFIKPKPKNTSSDTPSEASQNAP